MCEFQKMCEFPSEKTKCESTIEKRKCGSRSAKKMCEFLSRMADFQRVGFQM